MATLIGERYNDARGDESYNSENRTTASTFDVTYYVQGSASEGPADILAVSGLPKIGSYLTLNGQTYSTIRCINRRLQELDTGNDVWTVECNFDTRTTVDSDTPEPEDPVDLQPVWGWGFETERIALKKDAVGDTPIVNTMDEQLLLETDVAIPVLTIERYQWSFSPDTIINYVNHVNSQTFWGASKYEVLCAGINDSQVEVNGVKLRKVQYVFKFKTYDEGWRVRVLNQGTRKRKLDPFHPKNAQPAASKAMVFLHTDAEHNPTFCVLDKDGYELGAGPTSAAVAPDFTPVPEEPTIANGGYLLFDQYPRVNFNMLGLGPW